MRAGGRSAAVLLAFVAPVQAEVCYSDAHDASLAVPPTAATAFNCPEAGRKTLTALAAAGYRVVKITPLVVGQAGPVVQMAQQLILERETRVFTHGFE